MSEVIIDGCNVAECEFYTVIEDCDGIHDICELYDEYCNTKKNCYFKQLQRAKAELEQLHKKYYHILNLAKQNADSSEYCMQELEAENEKLKIKNKSIAKDYIDVFNDYQKYKQALEDIKKSCNAYAKTEDYVIDQTFNEFLENVFIRINEVLTDVGN